MISNKKIKPKIISIIVTIFFLIQISFPAYANDNLTKDENNFSGTLIKYPDRNEIPIEINDVLVVEFYSKQL